MSSHRTEGLGRSLIFIVIFAWLNMLTAAQAYALSCEQYCTTGQALSSSQIFPNDGTYRCECECSATSGAECTLRVVEMPANAQNGMSGGTGCENGTSCKMDCPKNMCLEAYCSPLNGNASCSCFECSELDPPKQ